MKCVYCRENDNKDVEAVALAGGSFSGRKTSEDAYEFTPVCADHLSSWNDGAAEWFPAYQIEALRDEMKIPRKNTRSDSREATILDLKAVIIMRNAKICQLKERISELKQDSKNFETRVSNDLNAR
jgi:hypothetical protein